MIYEIEHREPDKIIFTEIDSLYEIYEFKLRDTIRNAIVALGGHPENQYYLSIKKIIPSQSKQLRFDLKGESDVSSDTKGMRQTDV
jgi:hypothetical protein